MPADPRQPRLPGRPELLAPAGGLEAGLAAFQYGADAVYLGLQRYSARADAQNFTLDELDRLLGYARSLTPRRRCFVAVNTLVLDGELDGLVETLGSLADLGADAVIVQDLGVARVARRHFPELELHASTQLAAHSAAAVETLRDLGFARVTLARELTLAEIRAAAAVPGVEVETFLHGALCYAYSGLCLFSSLLLGRSGNRGQCAYPCRDRWEVRSLTHRELLGPRPRPVGGRSPPPPGLLGPRPRPVGGQSPPPPGLLGPRPRPVGGQSPPPPAQGERATELLPEGLEGGFAFSMKDLALPDHVGALREAGVGCLKIEGRKKAPLYVAAAVDFYRRLLDGTLPAQERPAREADLQATFARPWTTLYLDDHRDKDVADRDHVGHRGTPVGTLQAVVKVAGGAAIRFRTSRPLARHDGLQIEVPGLDRPFGFGIATLRVVEASGGPGGAERHPARWSVAEAYEAPAGAVVEIPLPDGYPTLPLGAAISCSSSQDVKLRYRLERPNLAPHRARRAMRVDAEVGADRVRLAATAEVAPGRTVRAEAEVAGRFEPARDAGKMLATARAALEKLGDTRFALEELAWRDPDGRFVPVSRLNDARRALAEGLDRAVAADAAARVEAAKEELRSCFDRLGTSGHEGPAAVASGSAAVASDSARPEPVEGRDVTWILKTDRLATLDAFPPEELAAAEELVVDLGREPVRDLVPRLDALAARAGGRERLRLGLPLLVRAWEEKAIRARISALREAGFDRWELTNAASWALLGLRLGEPQQGLDLTSDWPLHCVNRAAALALRELGVRRVTLSPEDVRANLAALLAALGPAAAVIVHEDAPLFLSESCPYANLLGACPGPADCTFETMELVSSHGGHVQVVNDRCRSITLNDVPFSLAPRLRALVEAGARALRVHFVHRPYESAEALAIWRGLRRGEAVGPGHTGSFDRAGW